MAIETARQALGRAIRNALIATPAPNYGNKVYYDRVPPTGANRPYVVWYLTGGGELNDLRKLRAEFTVGIKCIGENTDQALTGAAAIAERLNDRGSQDATSGALAAGASWVITVSTQERVISTVEYESETVRLYHEGAVFRFTMERTS